MGVEAILTIIGGISLLVGIFGGGLEVERIKIPPIRPGLRVVSAVTGIILIVIAIALTRPELLSHLLPTPQPTPQLPPQATAVQQLTDVAQQGTAQLDALQPTATQVASATQVIQVTQAPLPTVIPVAIATAQVISVQVSAELPWQDTGIRVNLGDKLVIQYVAGQWDWTKNYPDFDAAGDPNPQNTCRNISLSGGICPLPDARAGALVAKTGNNDPFLVGNYVEYSLPDNASGEQTLFLMINDVFSGLGDNDGALQISVRVTSR